MYVKGNYYPKYDCDYMKECHHHMKDDCYKDDCQEHHEHVCCDIPNLPKPEKECVKTFKCVYRVYKVCHYRVFKICPVCSHEFDVVLHHGRCPKCMG
ncbi:hypothetical protein SAMN04490178_102112 [Propionispora vibrioides]|jgi:hypothetical protein|uniref:Uncharacterized protein n=1 Tax=Propionispora vibrioides TaxID=112903 RepID=A0A1H8PX27_9FIRM|nr:hypothetical protein SAMN04490178_102112 [Propionispora vibrioides]